MQIEVISFENRSISPCSPTTYLCSSFYPLCPQLTVFFSYSFCHLETVHLLAVQFFVFGKSQKCLLNILLRRNPHQEERFVKQFIAWSARSSSPVTHPVSRAGGAPAPAHALGEHCSAAQKQAFSSVLQAPPSSRG